MYLKSVEINGFKSFGKKAVLSFNTPVTAIVGPNGSGKSNVVEALRFVLGEQSMKSMRGKTGTDLIFKGSKLLSKLSRASVTLNFDNRNRIFNITGEGGKKVSFDFNEVAISREVFADGGNVYSINGTEVRLKDIIEMLSYVNIGASGHHIISQGEADRILNARPTDRREMIEDALGLKIYQYRLRDSERKLEKTILNIKEVGSLRREIAPHITFLKKQVEKIEKAEEMRKELGFFYSEYLDIEELEIKQVGIHLSHEKEVLTEKLKVIKPEMLLTDEENDEEREFTNQDKNIEETLSAINKLRGELARKIGKIEGMIESEEGKVGEAETPNSFVDKPVPLRDVLVFANDAENYLNQILREQNISLIYEIAERVKTSFKNFKDRIVTIEHATIDKESIKNKLEEFYKIKSEATSELEELNKKEDELTASRRDLYANRAEMMRSKLERDEARMRINMEKKDLENKLSLLSVQEDSYNGRKIRYDNECREASVLVGQYIFEYKKNRIEGQSNNNEQTQDERFKKIERLKIKLEDAGAAGGSDVLKEYEEVTGRDEFLAKELNDLHASMNDLRDLMHELKIKLDTEFKSGVLKINKEFQKFFELMFGGGSAFLSVIVEQKKKRKGDEEDMDEEVMSDREGEEKVFEHGIDINVSLPHKKVKELAMLSGGERSLTSIALLFAVSQVNPPPFLVLDETDAALDEANSRKYGNMIENLSATSQLIVVTHNRETMSRAQVLYGVTMDSLGTSKLLTIKLEEAVKIAK